MSSHSSWTEFARLWKPDLESRYRESQISCFYARIVTIFKEHITLSFSLSCLFFLASKYDVCTYKVHRFFHMPSDGIKLARGLKLVYICMRTLALGLAGTPPGASKIGPSRGGEEEEEEERHRDDERTMVSAD